MRVVAVRGTEYVGLATALLRRMRLASATGGIWEAADIQWWSRHERSTDAYDQLFWLDSADEPVAAVTVSDWTGSLQCDVFTLPAGREAEPAAWQAALRRVGELGAVPVEVPVRDDNATGRQLLAAAGFEPSGERFVSSWLAAADRPPVSVLAPGFRLRSRAEVQDLPHHLARRNGPDVAARLAICSLYRPELDLIVQAPGGEVAGYGLFWADPVTRVGLVEPIRTEEPYQCRGIARHIVTAGLDRLAARGCEQLKVSNDIELYLGMGFRPLAAARATGYRRERQ
jgi:predicted N-acetyltransferase YhbS